MTHTPDTGHRRIAAGTHYAREFALLDEAPNHEARPGELRTQLARAEAERDAARATSRALSTENEKLHAALAHVVDLVMQGAADPISAALDVLEEAGLDVFEPVADSFPERMLAVAA